MTDTQTPRRFSRIDRLPPYVFNVTAELKLAAAFTRSQWACRFGGGSFVVIADGARKSAYVAGNKRTSLQASMLRKPFPPMRRLLDNAFNISSMMKDRHEKSLIIFFLRIVEPE